MAYDMKRLLAMKSVYAQADQRLLEIEATPNPSRDFVYEHIKEYMLTRYMLKGADCDTDDLAELAQMSLAKSQELQDMGMKVEDILAPGCSGITSAASKKIHLLLSMQRLLGIHFDEMSVPSIESLWQLTDIVIDLVRDKG